MKTPHVKLIPRSPLRRGFLLIPLVLVCFALSPAQAVGPPQDGGYPNQNTAEGQDAVAGPTQSTIQEHLVLWNTLGSDLEVEHSVVGPPLMPLQELVYTPALLGSGILSTNADSVVQVSRNLLNPEQGTLVLWVRLVRVPGFFFNAQSQTFFGNRILNVTGDEFETGFTSNNGLGTSGWLLRMWNDKYYVFSIDGFGTISTRTLGAEGEDVFIAVRWNRNGVPEHGSEKIVLFRNRAKIGTYVEAPDAVWIGEFTRDFFLNLQFGSAGAPDLDLIYDDIKIFDVSLSDDQVRHLYTQGGCTPPPAGLVSWWPGNGNANDIIGNNNGVLQHGATFASGLVGRAFSVDGVDDFVAVPSSTDFDTQTVTLDAWVRPNPGYGREFAGHIGVIGRWGGGGLGKATWMLSLNATGHVLFWTHNNVSTTVLVSQTTIPVNVFSHIAATLEGSTAKIYINGAPNRVGSVGVPQPTSFFDVNIGIGGQAPGTPGEFGPSYFSGLIRG